MTSSNIREALEAARQRHSTCEDTFYACPASGECSNDTYEGSTECVCGATRVNSKIDAALAELDAAERCDKTHKYLWPGCVYCALDVAYDKLAELDATERPTTTEWRVRVRTRLGKFFSPWEAKDEAEALEIKADIERGDHPVRIETRTVTEWTVHAPLLNFSPPKEVGPCCAQMSPGKYMCSLQQGHDGLHEAYGSVEDGILESWPRNDAAERPTMTDMTASTVDLSAAATNGLCEAYMEETGLPASRISIVCKRADTGWEWSCCEIEEHPVASIPSVNDDPFNLSDDTEWEPDGREEGEFPAPQEQVVGEEPDTMTREEEWQEAAWGACVGTIPTPAKGGPRAMHPSHIHELGDEARLHKRNDKMTALKLASLRWAAQGGTATRDTADLLTFMADRFVAEHGEDEASDWVRAAYERARMLRNALQDQEQVVGESLEGGGVSAHVCPSPSSQPDDLRKAIDFIEWVLRNSSWIGCDLGGDEVQEAALKMGVCEKFPGGFNPDKHYDDEGYAEPGDDWYVIALAMSEPDKECPCATWARENPLLGTLHHPRCEHYVKPEVTPSTDDSDAQNTDLAKLADTLEGLAVHKDGGRRATTFLATDRVEKILELLRAHRCTPAPSLDLDSVEWGMFSGSLCASCGAEADELEATHCDQCGWERDNTSDLTKLADLLQGQMAVGDGSRKACIVIEADRVDAITKVLYAHRCTGLSEGDRAQAHKDISALESMIDTLNVCGNDYTDLLGGLARLREIAKRGEGK